MNKKTIFKISFTALCFSVLTSCTTTNTLYSWYDYEDAAYQYSKKATPELYQKMMEEYGKVGQQQKGKRKNVPPGFNAEYGYLLCKEGKKEEGLKYLKKEIEMYPESEAYISRLINQIEEK